MRFPFALSAVSAMLAVALVNAQTGEPQKPAAQTEQAKPAAQPAIPEMPADSKAFTDASRIMDPEKKIAALEQWKKDYPNSSTLASADELILSTLVTRMPEQKARILKLAKSTYQDAKPENRSAVANRVADTLLENNAFLKDAEHYAKISVSSFTQAKYLEAEHKRYAGRKSKPPTDEEILKRFREVRATRIATLGQVYFKMGRTDKARPLLQESYGVVQEQMVVAAALGDMAWKAGDDAKALDYLVPAELSGRPGAVAIAGPDLEAIYRKQHAGSLDGFDAMLDAEYRKRFSNPVPVTAYKPGEKRSDRLVLAEVFTGAGCPPCVGADVAFDAALERYSRKDLAVVMYHVHVPQPDPMTTVETPDLSKAYAVRGVPTYFIDGKTIGGGGGSRDYAKTVFGRFNPAIEKDLETPAEAEIAASATLEGNTVQVKAAVNDVKTDAKELKVVALLIEKRIRYTGENGVRFHPMVVRAVATRELSGGDFSPSFDLDAVSASLKKSLDEYEAKGHRGNVFKFREKKYQIDRGNLAVVVFVKNGKDQHVLQAAYIDLSPAGPETRITDSGAK
jgi:thiol-disulfide isomerase/thioredoxin